jgi:hypothetical protein
VGDKYSEPGKQGITPVKRGIEIPGHGSSQKGQNNGKRQERSPAYHQPPIHSGNPFSIGLLGFVFLIHERLPALLMDIYAASGAVIDVSVSFFFTDRAFHKETSVIRESNSLNFIIKTNYVHA